MVLAAQGSLSALPLEQMWPAVTSCQWLVGKRGAMLPVLVECTVACLSSHSTVTLDVDPHDYKERAPAAGPFTQQEPCITERLFLAHALGLVQ